MAKKPLPILWHVHYYDTGFYGGVWHRYSTFWIIEAISKESAYVTAEKTLPYVWSTAKWRVQPVIGRVSPH